MNNTPKIWGIAFFLICTGNQILAQTNEEKTESPFDNNILIGAVIAALVAVLVIRYRTNKKEK